MTDTPVLNTSYQVGSALGLAAMTALAVSQGSGELGNPQALTDGFSAAFLGAAGIAVVADCWLALLRPRAHRRRPRSQPSDRWSRSSPGRDGLGGERMQALAPTPRRRFGF